MNETLIALLEEFAATRLKEEPPSRGEIVGFIQRAYQIGLSEVKTADRRTAYEAAAIAGMSSDPELQLEAIASDAKRLAAIMMGEE